MRNECRACALWTMDFARRIVLIGFSSVRRRRADAEGQLGGVTRWRERFQGAGCRLYAERLPPRFVGGLSQAMKGWASAWTADCGHVLRNAE